MNKLRLHGAFLAVFLLLLAGVAFAATPSTLAATASPVPGEDPAMTVLAKKLLAQAQSGKPDQSLFSARMNAALTPDMVASVAQQLAPLGTPAEVRFMSETSASGYEQYRYRIVWPAGSLDETFALDQSGKIIGWFFKPASDAAPSNSASSNSSSAPSPSASP
jgi:hypothetical protein